MAHTPLVIDVAASSASLSGAPGRRWRLSHVVAKPAWSARSMPVSPGAEGQRPLGRHNGLRSAQPAAAARLRVTAAMGERIDGASAELLRRPQPRRARKDPLARDLRGGQHPPRRPLADSGSPARRLEQREGARPRRETSKFGRTSSASTDDRRTLASAGACGSRHAVADHTRGSSAAAAVARTAQTLASRAEAKDRVSVGCWSL
jgi:hypothetical protein